LFSRFQRSFKIIYTGFNFEANAKLAEVKAEIKNNSTLNVEINVLESVDDVDLSGSLALQTEQGNYTNFMTKNVNFCKMVKDPNVDPMMSLMYRDMLKQGKFFKKCPVQKGIYTLEDYHVDEEILPSFLPETNFRMTMRLGKPKGEKIFQGVLFGRIDKSKGFNNLKMFSLG